MTTERILTEYTADTRAFERGASRYEQTLARHERLVNARLTRIDQRWERSSRIIGLTTTALGGVASAAAALQLRALGEEFRGVERALASIGETGDAASKGLIDLAIRTRSEIGGTSSAVQSLAKSTGADLDTTIRRVETLQKLLASGGASGGERASVALQLGQALQAGVLSGDEFKSISENAPAEFLDALAKSAGVARSALKGVAEAQQLTTDVVLNAIDSMASTADARFRDLAVSGEEAVSVLRAGLVSFVGSVDQSLGATETLNAAMVHLGEYMAGSGEEAQTLASAFRIATAAATALAGARGLAGLRQAFRDAAEARRDDVAEAQRALTAAREDIRLAEQSLVTKAMRVRQLAEEGRATNSVERAMRSQVAAAQNLAAAEARAAAAAATLGAAQSRLSLATRVTTARVKAWSGVMAFFGGPVSLAITAAGALAVAISQIPSASERTASALDSTASAASRLESALTEVSSLDTQIASLKEQMRAASERYSAAVGAEGDAAAKTAAVEIASIQGRIEMLDKLRQARLAEAQLAAIQAKESLQGAEDGLRREVAAQIGSPGRGPQDPAKRAEFNARRQAELDAAVAAAKSELPGRLASGDTTLTESERQIAVTSAKLQSLSAQVELLGQKLDTTASAAAVSGAAAAEAVTAPAQVAVKSIIDGAGLASRKIAELEGQAAKLRDAIDNGSLDPKTAAEAREALAKIGKEIDSLKDKTGGKKSGGKEKGDGVTLISEEQIDTLDEAKTLLNSLVQQTQTEAEARAERDRRATDARKILVAAYGEESAAVRSLDVATNRLHDTGAEAAATLGNAIGQAALETRNLEDGLKQVLVQLLQLNGAKAFQSLFTGGGAGGFLGTLLTGAPFAGGGIMTGRGPVPLRRYASGGIATSPQLALFGEGRVPEAYVPLQDGRSIPVTVKGGGAGIYYSPTINIDAGAGDPRAIAREVEAAARRVADQMFQRLRREGVI